MIKKRNLSASLILCLVMIFMMGINIFAQDEKNKRMRGIWVATIYSLDYPEKVTMKPEELKKQADEIINNSVKMGMTDIFLQVRPSCDAFYKSSYFPWSKYLTGKQGVGPKNDFDVLKYWVKKCHENGLKLHAWVNFIESRKMAI